MKKFSLPLIVVIILVTLSSCLGSRMGEATPDFDPNVPSCERFNTGKICFVNRTIRRVSLEIDKQIVQIPAIGKTCLDMEAKSYRYKAEQTEGRRKTKWKSTSLYITTCQDREIELYSKN